MPADTTVLTANMVIYLCNISSRGILFIRLGTEITVVQLWSWAMVHDFTSTVLLFFIMV